MHYFQLGGWNKLKGTPFTEQVSWYISHTNSISDNCWQGSTFHAHIETFQKYKVQYYICHISYQDWIERQFRESVWAKEIWNNYNETFQRIEKHYCKKITLCLIKYFRWGIQKVQYIIWKNEYHRNIDQWNHDDSNNWNSEIKIGFFIIQIRFCP